jgi:hypothetical protein
MEILLMVLLQVTDGVTTYISLRMGGREVNPIMRLIMIAIGRVPAIIITKVAVVYVLVDSPNWSLNVLNTLYVLIVIVNIRTIMTLVGNHGKN